CCPACSLSAPSCSRYRAFFYLLTSFFYSVGAHRYLHSFPTRRSSDLVAGADVLVRIGGLGNLEFGALDKNAIVLDLTGARWSGRDRKSTRLNSSHVSISYAVFCLKKKKLKQVHCRFSTTVSA